MIAVTYLPPFITILFREMPGIWKHRHRLVRCWLIVLQALFPGRKTLEELAHWTPGSITVWRFRCVLKVAYWDIHLLEAWWVEEALHILPPPKDGTPYLVGDGSVKPKRGTHNPLAQKGWKSEHQPWFFASVSPHSPQTPSKVPNGKCAVPCHSLGVNSASVGHYCDGGRRCSVWLPREYQDDPTERRCRYHPALRRCLRHYSDLENSGR
jgi:hypothetical protein